MPTTLNLTLNLNFSRNLKPNCKSKTITKIQHKISTNLPIPMPMPMPIQQKPALQHRAPRVGIVKSRYPSPLPSLYIPNYILPQVQEKEKKRILDTS